VGCGPEPTVPDLPAARLRRVAPGYWRMGDSDVTIGRQRPDGWKVASSWLLSADWLQANGMLGASFPTLSSAARALTAAAGMSGPPPTPTHQPAPLRHAGPGLYVAGKDDGFTVARAGGGWHVDHGSARIAWCRTLHEARRRIGSLIA